MRLTLALVSAVLAPQPLGVVEHTLGRFERDTLQPVGPTIAVEEPHARPALAPDGRRFAIGLSSSGLPDPPTPGRGRVGLWIVDAGAMRIERQVRTGIAAEAVVFPGMVAAMLQSGALVVVDPDSGEILSRRQIGFSFGTPDGEVVAGRGVLVNEVRRGRGIEVAVVSAAGRVRRTFIRVPGMTRDVALAGSDRRAFIVGKGRIATLDPATLRVRTRRFDGVASTAAFTGTTLAIGGTRGLRMYDTRTWRLLARDSRSTDVFVSGRTIIAGGRGKITARSTTGRVLWRAAGDATAVAAGRVYAQPAVLDVATGARVGTHPRNLYALSVIDG
ncbi:hypothetical protein OJ997_06990 [Solirubrobacter phytolaccae]|uniref:Uncharacterized protein n=1 Tax=Solirubrobacter phytolaccae TaxID=1404360 RepID=A0A9X3SA82_9ACTN|nr:hypothetical protein [Solirubrobacter phytolaccae]MDA0180035.1 hypothetical protein [Solirubrobacter phytolaccae]